MAVIRVAPAGALASVLALGILTAVVVVSPPVATDDPRPAPVCQCGEICDGLDNDCDGLVDENIPDRIHGIEFGTCRPEVLRCINGEYRAIQHGVDEGCDLEISTRRKGADGTEVNEERWVASGIGQGTNLIGHEPGQYYDLGLRFFAPELQPGQRFIHARVGLSATGTGDVTSGLTLRIVGLAAAEVGSFRDKRPSEYEKTDAVVTWHLPQDWAGPTNDERRKCMPFRRYSPDISPIINELLSRPDWSSGNRMIGLAIEDRSTAGDTNFVAVEDSMGRTSWCRADHSPVLALYPTVRSTLVGKELLGRVTDRSVTVNTHALIPIDVGFIFGTRPGILDASTPMKSYGAGQEIEEVIGGLRPDTRYYYRMQYRRLGTDEISAGPEHTFHTQRPPGSSFNFVVQADSHVIGAIAKGQRRSLALYRETLANELAREPDFLLDLGDTFHSQYFAGRDAKDFEEARQRHLTVRKFFDLVGHSVPLFFAIGNHEGEQGWRLDGTPDNVAVWATGARKLLYANPAPDDFYRALGTELPFIGQRESTFAWHWGDALFVVLDPFWYTQINPHPKARGAGAQDPWRWTLGYEQYQWLRETLSASDARFKLVFIHHLTGGLERKPYGRGGARAVKHALGNRGSFEWGGENRNGTWGFAEKRPGWYKPIHDLLVENEVAVVFHGHDHCFAWETVDGIAYLAVPVPGETGAGYGFCWKRGLYGGAVQRPNSGFIEVAVEPTRLQIDYIRTRPNRPNLNGQSVFTATIYDCNQNGVMDTKEGLSHPSLDPQGFGGAGPCNPGRNLGPTAAGGEAIR